MGTGIQAGPGIAIEFDGQSVILYEWNEASEAQSRQLSPPGQVQVVATVTVLALPDGTFSTEYPAAQPLPSSPQPAVASSVALESVVDASPETQAPSPQPSPDLMSSSPIVSPSFTPSVSSNVNDPTSSVWQSLAPSSVAATSAGTDSTPPAASSDPLSASSEPSSGSSSPLASSSFISGSLAPTTAASIPALPSTDTSGSNLITHEAPMYAGIVLGSIGGIALFCALIAWVLRLRQARRRRAAETQLPWAREDDGFGGVEAGYASDWNADARRRPGEDAGAQQSSRAWDLDVGEPRRSDSYENRPGFLTNHHVPSHEFFSGGIGESGRVPYGNYPHARKPTVRQLPSHLVNEKLSAQNYGHDPMGGELELGTPREGVDIPRYLSLKAKGDVLDVPWNTGNDTPPRSMAERLRRLGKPHERWEESAAEIKVPRRPGEDTRQQDGWTASITSNLVNAFNAVAANIPAFGSADAEDREIFTPVPSKRGAARASMRSTPFDSGKRQLGHGGLSRADTKSSKSSVESQLPWTLEETTHGAGIVHLHVKPPSLGPIHENRAVAKDRSSVSFGDGNGNMMSVDNHGETSLSSLSGAASERESPIPLVASNRPQAALLKTDISNYFRAQPDQGLWRLADRISQRQNSDSTTASVPSTVAQTTRRPTGPLKVNKRWKPPDDDGAGNDKTGLQRRPSLISRLSSSTSSATSWNSYSSLTTRNQVFDALRARRRTYSREFQSPPLS